MQDTNDDVLETTVNYATQLKQVADYVQRYYLEHSDARLFYHNISHTKEMMEASRKIAAHYHLNEHEVFIVTVAAWFHDIGYLTTESELHEIKSAEMADTFLHSLGVSDDDLRQIKGCIMATKMPQGPQTLLEKIVCDADLYHLGTDLFKEKSKLIRKEAEAFKNQPIGGSDWRASSIKLLENHHYHTDYAKNILDKTKAENLEKLKKKHLEKSNPKPGTYIEPHLENSPEIDEIYGNPDMKVNDLGIPKSAQNAWWEHDKAEKGHKEKTRKSEKSIETMFRIASANHQRLSSMADNKAHIMINVNSIIMSVSIGLVVKKLDENRNLIIPTLILLAVNVVTIVYSVLATRPKIPQGKFSKEQVVNKSINLLFFGNFYKMNYPDYDWGMKRMMHDKEFLYESLINDMYWHGVVLGKKYKLLRTSYTVFMFGLAASIIAYSLAIIFI